MGAGEGEEVGDMREGEGVGAGEGEEVGDMREGEEIGDMREGAEGEEAREAGQGDMREGDVKDSVDIGEDTESSSVEGAPPQSLLDNIFSRIRAEETKKPEEEKDLPKLDVPPQTTQQNGGRTKKHRSTSHSKTQRHR